MTPGASPLGDGDGDADAARRVLVTGAGGQLGRDVVERLVADAQTPWRVIAVDHARLDIADGQAVREALLAAAPHVIINAAAYTRVDDAEADTATAHAVNADGPRHLAAVAADLDAALLHVSTDYVFDGMATRPYTETDPPAPVNRYGESKLAGDQAVLASAARHVVLRTGWVYADHGRNFYTTMARLMAGRDEVRVVADQIGAPNPTWWLADCIVDFATRVASGANGAPRGLLNLACSGQTSWRGFATAIRDHLDLTCDVVAIGARDYPTPAPRPAYSVLDTTRLRHLGVTVPSWQAALARVPAPAGMSRHA